MAIYVVIYRVRLALDCMCCFFLIFFFPFLFGVTSKGCVHSSNMSEQCREEHILQHTVSCQAAELLHVAVSISQGTSSHCAPRDRCAFTQL